MHQTSVRSVRRPLAVVFAAFLMASCGGGGGDPGSPPFDGPGAGSPPFGGGGGGGGQTGDGQRPRPDETIVPTSDALQVTVLGAASGAPVQGATVVAGALTRTTDGNGRISIASFTPTPRLVMEATAANYETAYRVTRVVAGVPSLSVIKLIAFGTTETIDAAAGGVVEATDSPLRLSVPPSSLENADGSGVNGDVEVRVTDFAPGSDSSVLSGDYTDAAGDALESFGGAIIAVGNDLRAAAGAQLELRIPVSTRSSSAPTTANLYRFDPATGRWEPRGQATLTAGSPGYYTAVVDEFGQWMVGLPLAGGATVTGCVQDEAGAPVADVSVEAEGISYTGINQGVTGADGRFTLSVRPGSTVMVSGHHGAAQTNAVSVATSTGATNIPTCLTLPARNAVTVRLTWGQSPADIDSHLKMPGGTHIYYVNKGSLTAEPYASLDVDDTNGYGPEVTTIRNPKRGIYRFYLHNYSGTFSPGMTGSPTRVELNYLGRVVVFTPPAGEGTSRYWHLFDLEIGENCSMTLYRYNRWRADEPGNPNSGTTAQACVPQ